MNVMACIIKPKSIYYEKNPSYTRNGGKPQDTC